MMLSMIPPQEVCPRTIRTIVALSFYYVLIRVYSLYMGVWMDVVYDEIEIEDMEWDDTLKAYTYPCPCGDKFRITKSDLLNYDDIARCPSCSLLIRVIYEIEDLEDEEED